MKIQRTKKGADHTLLLAVSVCGEFGTVRWAMRVVVMMIRWLRLWRELMFVAQAVFAIIVKDVPSICTRVFELIAREGKRGHHGKRAKRVGWSAVTGLPKLRSSTRFDRDFNT